MNDHEDSREAFEKAHTDFQLNLNRDVGLKSFPDYYYNSTVQHMWQAWIRALDWRDSQVCPTTFTVIPVNHAKIYSYQHECGGNSACVDKHIDFREANPYCPACGRRVKIQEQQTNDTNEQ